jgi:hypothetical protein
MVNMQESYFSISETPILDIQNSNSGYQKFLFWLSKFRIFDIRNSAVILDIENSNA